jgi:hypothetical protein
MNRTALLLAAILPLTGCHIILNEVSPPGEMNSNGKINPCHDFRSNPQACGEAQYNAPRVRKLGIGQTIAQAQQIMGRDPEERSLKVQDGQSIEIWFYLTDYDRSIVSVITFTDGKITSIEPLYR